MFVCGNLWFYRVQSGLIGFILVNCGLFGYKVVFSGMFGLKRGKTGRRDFCEFTVHLFWVHII